MGKRIEMSNNMDHEVENATSNDRLCTSLTQRSLSRRGFIALGALSAASMLVPLASCAPSNASSSASGAASAAQDSIVNPDELLIAQIQEQISNMTLDQKVAQLFVVRPEDLVGLGSVDGGVQNEAGNSGEAITEMSDALRSALEKIPVGGIASFSRNIVDPEQIKSLLSGMSDAVKDAVGITPLMCVDEEGGLVARVASNEAFGVQNTGNASDIGATGDPEQAKQTAKTIAEYLKPLGFNTDFAPVADVVSDLSDEVMTARSLGTDALKVSEMVAAEVEGFNEAGMICTLKHFPGLGSASGDTHLEKVTTDKTAEEIMNSDALPFKAGIEAGAPMVMVGHISAPNVDENDEPSVTSSIIINNLLRRDLGFDGVVITDALNMAAVSDYYDSGSAAITCFKAGCDMLLMPENFAEAFDAIMETVKSGVISSDDIDLSVARILIMKNRYLSDDAS